MDLISRINELESELKIQENNKQNLIEENKKLEIENKKLIEENKKLEEEKSKLNYEIKKLEETIKNTGGNIISKEDLKLNITQSNHYVNTLHRGETVMSINIMTMGNQDIANYSIPCKNTDLFVKVEEKIYMDYPKYKQLDTFYQVNTRRIKRFLTMEENKIQSNDIITLFVFDDENK